MDPQTEKSMNQKNDPRQISQPVPLPVELAKTFLLTGNHFQLGHLPTETQHPKTTQLSQLAASGREGLVKSIALLKEVELDALRALQPRMMAIEAMASEIQSTFKSKGRVFLCGCGATGRLSLSLETLWREECARIGHPHAAGSVISFMAGGDYAMVRSIENFEDHPEYGARQLRDLGFQENDLLIGTTEGGETPFVIGAVEEAARVSKRPPYMLFCNPADLLRKTVERSRRAIENPGIKSISIETGPMALAGSTRLQATTALMLATGAALFGNLDQPLHPKTFIDEFSTILHTTDLSHLAPLIETESQLYKSGGLCVHRTSRHAITVLTDTTERSPTFSLLPFENVLDQEQPMSWTYVVHTQAETARDAWQKILGRDARALDWAGFIERYGVQQLLGFDFSPTTELRRRTRAATERGRELAAFTIESNARDLSLHLKGVETRIPRATSLLCEHLLLKITLNISSTLAMGLLGRFSGNLMLYVRAANNKLVDRAIRYVRILLADAGITQFGYDDVCMALFETSAQLTASEPAVWRTFERLRKLASEQR
jgi:N-acetylmuramic acid 6-phosphate etherase